MKDRVENGFIREASIRELVDYLKSSKRGWLECRYSWRERGMGVYDTEETREANFKLKSAEDGKFFVLRHEGTHSESLDVGQIEDLEKTLENPIINLKQGYPQVILAAISRTTKEHKKND